MKGDEKRQVAHSFAIGLEHPEHLLDHCLGLGHMFQKGHVDEEIHALILHREVGGIGHHVHAVKGEQIHIDHVLPLMQGLRSTAQVENDRLGIMSPQFPA